MSASLVGSEMCIRDRLKMVRTIHPCAFGRVLADDLIFGIDGDENMGGGRIVLRPSSCLLYTSPSPRD
eukprot:7721142-Alexandrium_andersonii.AAC.1